MLENKLQDAQIKACQFDALVAQSGFLNRPKLQQLLKLVLENKVNKIYITYKDRLTRFGFDYLKSVCDFYNVEIIILHDEKDKSIQQELVEDMMNLLASFSGKLYGMRSSKNKNKSLFTEKLEEAIAKEK